MNYIHVTNTNLEVQYDITTFYIYKYVAYKIELLFQQLLNIYYNHNKPTRHKNWYMVGSVLQLVPEQSNTVIAIPAQNLHIFSIKLLYLNQ